MALLHLDLRRRHSLQAWSAKPRGMSRSPNPAPRLRAKSEAAPDPKPDGPSERLASAEDALSSMVIEEGQARLVARVWVVGVDRGAVVVEEEGESGDLGTREQV